MEDSALERLRRAPENPHGFWGMGPLLALALLIVLMVVLAPTIAPEQIVLVPTDDPTTTTTTTATATATTTTEPAP